MENNSGIIPVGRALLLKMDGVEQAGGVIEVPEHVKRQSNLLQDRGFVIQVGETCWHDEPAPRAKVGDYVIVTKMAGYIAVGTDGELYRLVNDRDLFARLVPKEVANG